MRLLDANVISLSLGLLIGILIRVIPVFYSWHKPKIFSISRDAALYHIRNDVSLKLDRSNSDRIIDGHPVVAFDDHYLHDDVDNVAKKLAKEVRVLCWVMTSPDSLRTRAIHLRETWVKRCNKFLFMSDEDDAEFPAIGVDTEAGRSHLTAKTMRSFDYIYKHHFDDADWFMKVDDDTYVIVENLRYMLSAHSMEEPIFFGHHFKTIVQQGYFSGGAGYVLSKEALTRFAHRKEDDCAKDSGAEDVSMGKCMEKLGVMPGDSRDRLGRSRFHCFNPGTHIIGGYPNWYFKYDKYGAQKGIDSVSDYPVSFHYVGSAGMYYLEYTFYHLGTHGIIHGLQNLNPTNNQTL